VILSRKRRQFLLFVVDFAVLYGTLYLSLVLRNGSLPSAVSWSQHVFAFSIAFLGWAVIFYTAGLYALESLYDSARFAARLFWCVSIATLSTALMFYLWPRLLIAPKTVLFLFAILAFTLIWLWRFGYGKVVRASAIRYTVAFIGVTDDVLYLADTIKGNPHLGYSLAFIHDEESRCADNGKPLLCNPEDLRQAVSQRLPDLFVMTDSARLDLETRRLLFSLVGKGARYMNLSEFYETVVRRIPINVINDTWFLRNIDLRGKKPYLAFKRLLDLFAATAAIIFSLPLWLLVALAVRLESRGPVIFRQVRIGQGGRLFTILKFRTMRTEENSYVPTVVGDSRITRVGLFLRSSRLDELPQIINILRGDMSFVGPRPERPELAADLAKAIPYYMERHLVKPGITGWDQVSGEYHSPSIEDTYKKLQYDLYYIKNTSPFLDASIFFKTIMTVLSRSGR
jgi:exopolysaccharide biosynthesis polyprenyl glycosylphosphotransferase